MLIVDESACSVCADLPFGAKSRMRESLLEVWVHRPLCEACLMAFARNIGLPPEEEPNSPLVPSH
jgi:hypothetical protein